jgi:hypothetical protein
MCIHLHEFMWIYTNLYQLIWNETIYLDVCEFTIILTRFYLISFQIIWFIPNLCKFMRICFEFVLENMHTAALPHTAALLDSLTLPQALPHTTVRTAAHGQVDCRTHPRTAAHIRAHCSTLPYCHTLPHTATLPDSCTLSRALPNSRTLLQALPRHASCTAAHCRAAWIKFRTQHTVNYKHTAHSRTPQIFNMNSNYFMWIYVNICEYMRIYMNQNSFTCMCMNLHEY